MADTFYDSSLVEGTPFGSWKLSDYNDHHGTTTRNSIKPVTSRWDIKQTIDIVRNEPRLNILFHELRATLPKLLITLFLASAGLSLLPLSNYWIILFLFFTPMALRYVSHILTIYIVLGRTKLSNQQ